ncbi:Crp/Fnr family transcriptional regulator [Actinomadura graeca]|uniref:Crp/Fnr family transcriptional regulator n=1 Tax=Actinomadura graeca TaxID=2750812 RepID=A0ABX8QQW4_9ACTN|nr:Crp/Fnr family transcriptional regulator [Actinomadura graeca]QXJ21186.1 Crp/Fnr family transcriptional regulator [Actinomadura graeca]
MANHNDAPRPVGGWPRRSFLGTLDAPDRARLLKLGTSRQIAAGETLIMEGTTEPREVFVLLQGCAKVTSATDGGDTVLLSIRADGDLVGELAVLDDCPRLARVTTIGPCVVRRIGQPEFLEFLAASPGAFLAVSRIVSARLRNATWHRVEYGGSSVPVRIARMLMMLAREHGRPAAEGTLITLPLTHPDMAGLVGAKEPTVQKALASLKHRKVIDKGYREIVIRDWPALHTAAGITEIPPEYGID